MKKSCSKTISYKLLEDTPSREAINDQIPKQVQPKRNVIHSRSTDDNACSQEVQRNIHEKKDKVCDYCKKSEHSVNNCPFFVNAIEQQSNMLSTYNALSVNNHSNDYSNHFELMQTAQKEYYNKQCKHCKKYGHLEDKCTHLEKTADKDDSEINKQADGEWTNIEIRKSRKARKNIHALESVAHDLPQTDRTTNDNANKTKENYFSVVKFCHYCKEYGHIEDICPLVQKALKKQKIKTATISPRIRKANFSNSTAKVKGSKKPRICDYCGDSDHREDDCEKKQYDYINKNQPCFKEQVQLKDVCPLLEEGVKKVKNQNKKLYVSGQVATNDQNSRKVKNSKKCNFCGDYDHNESECAVKVRYEHLIATTEYCDYCKNYGHLEDKCPLVEEAAKEMKKRNYCEPESSKKVIFANDVTTLTENLADLKICNYCDEFGHNENQCFVQQQAEFYSKFCDLCKENGHYTNNCVLSKLSTGSNTLSNNYLKELEFRTRICCDHCMCENCHSITYFQEEKISSRNTGSAQLKSSFETNVHKFRYCTLCGIKGLSDACILKERVAAK